MLGFKLIHVCDFISWLDWNSYIFFHHRALNPYYGSGFINNSPINKLMKYLHGDCKHSIQVVYTDIDFVEVVFKQEWDWSMWKNLRFLVSNSTDWNLKLLKPFNLFMSYSTRQKFEMTSGPRINTVKPVYNDQLMGYFSALWSPSRWPRAT